VPYLANYSASVAEVASSLGRPLAGGRRSVIVPLVAPQTLFEPRREILDVRFSKVFDLTDLTRLQVNLDVYNLLNDAAILNVNGNYGSGWRRPIVRGIAAPRLFQMSARVTF
jgi:outer membrane receptor protein involved in Fe transport